MAIEAQEGLFQVRLRFTDGNGNFSRHYTTDSISTQEIPVIPDVEDFMLFSWGREVWGTWTPNNEYQTEVEFELGEEWLDVTEGYVQAGQGEA